MHTVLALLVSEILRNGDTCQSHASTGAWGLVHLAEHKRHLGLAVKLNDTSLLHLVVQIVAFARPLANTRENRVTTVSLCDVVLRS